jgi:O-antigen/teichoic acid export membrane protein
MGEYSYITWLVATASTLATLGFVRAMLKYVAEFAVLGDPRAVKRIIYAITFSVLLLCIVVTVALAVGVHFLPMWKPYQTYLGLIIGLIFVQALQQLTIVILQGLDEFSTLAYISTGIDLARLALTGLVLLLGWGVIGALSVLLFVWGLYALWSLYLSRQMVSQIKISKSHVTEGIQWGRVARFIALTSVNVLIQMIIWRRSETFFLNLFSSQEEVAYYSIAYSLTKKSMLLLPGAITGVLFPAISGHFGAGKHEKVSSSFFQGLKYVALLAIPLSVGGVVVAKRFVLVAYGDNYLAMTSAMQILFVSSMVGTLMSPASSLIYGIEKPAFFSITGIPLVVINIGASLLLIPRWAATGAAIANLAAQSLVVIISYAYVINLQFRIPWTDLVRMLLVATVMGISVKTILSLIPGFWGLAFGIIAGSFIYFALLMQTRVVDNEMHSRLSQVFNLRFGAPK